MLIAVLLPASLPACRQRPDATDVKVDLKLFSRLRLACQLEAVLNQLLAMAPPLFALPSLSAAPGSGGPRAAALVAKKVYTTAASAGLASILAA